MQIRIKGKFLKKIFTPEEQGYIKANHLTKTAKDIAVQLRNCTVNHIAAFKRENGLVQPRHNALKKVEEVDRQGYFNVYAFENWVA